MVTRSTWPLLLASGLLIVPVLVWWALGMTLNHTPSVATGIWYARQTAPVLPAIGEIVRTCLNPEAQAEYRARGYLRWGVECDGSEALLKPVGAVAGDRYAVTEAGIVINGELVPDTRPLRVDNAGRQLTLAGEGVLAPNEVLLISRWPTSLDSRYFGPVSTDRLIATMKPLWTWH